MRFDDAIASLQLGRKKKSVTRELVTVWSEQADDGPQAVPLPEYPRPQLERPEAEWRCLNGWWDYGISPADSAKRDVLEEPEGKILVPFSPEAKRSGVGRTLKPGELLWYRRNIENVRLPEGSRLILHFGAVDERCSIYWNGNKVGNHRNGYLAFHYDVTEYVRNGDNELKVFVWDDTDKGVECRGKQTLKPGGMFYQAQSGIWQTVWLEIVPEFYLKRLKIVPFPDEEAVELELIYSGELSEEAEELRLFDAAEDQNAAKAARPRELRITVGEPGIIRGDGQWTCEDAAGRDVPGAGEEVAGGDVSDAGEGVAGRDVPGAGEEVAGREVPDAGEECGAAETFAREYSFPWKEKMRVRIPVTNPRLWSPEHPELYPLRIEAGEDAVSSYFAMRSFGLGEDGDGRIRLLLNGEPYFFNGVLDQGYWPESLMTAPSDEAFVHDITQMKEAGFNTIRKHVKIEAARWYYHCDRLGMVVWQDMVNGGGKLNKLLETYMPTVIPAAGRAVKDDRYKLLGRDDAKSRQRFERDLMRMIRQLGNCPCIGMWVPFNEGWGQFDALRIEKAVKKADPARIVDHASGWFDQGGGDVRSVHNYFRPLAVERKEGRFANILRAVRPGKDSGAAGRAFVISEYGGANCRIEDHCMSEEEYGYSSAGPDEFPKVFEETMENVRALAGDGLSGAVYTQVSDIEEETNGIMTYDRKVCKLRRQDAESFTD